MLSLPVLSYLIHFSCSLNVFFQASTNVQCADLMLLSVPLVGILYLNGCSKLGANKPLGLDLHNWVINCQLLFSLWGITVSRRASLLLLPCKECGKNNLILSEEIRLLSISVVIDNAGVVVTQGSCHNNKV